LLKNCIEMKGEHMPHGIPNHDSQSEGGTALVEKMNHFIFRLLPVFAVATLFVFASQPTLAADFPAKGKVITTIVQYGAGGGADVTVRIMQPWLEKELGVPMPIINKPGGGGQIGFTEFIKTAKPDGYTIGIAMLPAIPAAYLDPRRKATFGRKDFRLVANIAVDPMTVLVMPNSPYKSLKDLVAAAKANPKKIRATSSGVMTTSHLAAVQLELATGIKFAHMFYEEQGEQRAALLGGHADVEFKPISAAGTPAAVTSGQLRCLAIYDDKPNHYLPNIPTTLSQGFPVKMAAARGFAVAAGTPDDIVAILANAVKKVISDPENEKQLDKSMMSTRFMTGKEYEDYWKECEKTVQAVLDATAKK
jgi:tripartite-type tricarboxylate transporter receptor subunit TctC